MNVLDFIPGGRMVQALVVAAALAALIGGITYAVHSYNDNLREEGRAEVRSAWTAQNEQREAVAAAEREKNAKEGFRRVEQQAAIEQRKTNEIADLNDRVARLVGELRSRPERPTGGSATANNPAPAQACTGAELYRPDADFLVREAARAQRILLERDTCHDKYDSLTVKP